ncbi:hypothetical protein [Mesorhizobium sp. ZC-5]|uniref:hypothetical protein n=1 Tax=Mesorhizobium sp. ZC-5 TaxID=2986066 RepID=UPI0021E924A3|nr:hypothetical protein [Mesorhizobium sp. ZC-5]MCV3239689.1 hypothetical protein [Mesorhizobium sp. ZC-5]
MNESYELIGRILSHLQARGLRRTDLWLVDLYGGTLPDGDAEEHELLFGDVMNWLIKEGAVTIIEEIPGTTDESGFMGTQLTSRGLAMMQTPTGGELPKPTIQETIATPDASLGASTYVKIGSLFGGLLGGFTKSIS